MAGGTYEYGYRSLNQWLGFTAGWLFLLAKTASAATAALGVALYLRTDSVIVPVVAAALVTALVAAGIRRTTVVNTLLVTLTVTAIIWFAISGLRGSESGAANFASSPEGSEILAAVAFLFVAYTGYGRIATLGEEVHDPERTIPRAVVVTLAVTAVLYMAIEIGGRAMAGPSWGAAVQLGLLDMPLVTIGAVTAMLGVLLNLVLGLSRVWLAMGRRHDMPRVFAQLGGKRSQPTAAIVLSGLAVAAVTLIGDISLAWSFSAMTVLLYYGITNLSALRLDPRRPTGWAGLASCVFLSFFVPLSVWLTGLGMIALGLGWKAAFTALR